MTIILPLFLIIVVASLVFMVKAWKRFVTVKMTHWLLMSYVGLLLIAMVIVPFISTDLPDQVSASEQSRNEFYQHLGNGKIGSINPEYIAQHKTFDYENSTLKISSNRIDGTLIYVERKDTNDGEINCFVYKRGLIINGFNFTDKLAPIHLELNKNTMNIHQPPPQDISLAMVKKEFTINQFSVENLNNETMEPDQQVIYLRVPKDLEISNDQVNVINVE